MRIEPVIVDDHTGGVSADIKDDEGRLIGSLEITVTPKLTMPDGTVRESRRLWTLNDSMGNELGSGDL